MTETQPRRQKDKALERFLNLNDVFAAAVNYFLPQEEAITEEDLEDFSDSLQYYKDDRLKYVERDVMKKVKGRGLWIIGIENQCYRDSWFPIRLATYDALSYYNIYREKLDSRKKLGDEKEAEDEDLGIPPDITTFILNFSSQKLDGMKLSDLWEGKEYHTGLAYTVRSIDVEKLTTDDLEKVPEGDFRKFLSLMTFKQDHIQVPLHGEEFFSAVRELTGNLSDPIIKDKFEGYLESMKKEKSSIPLFQAYIDSFEKGNAEGEARGEARGEAKAKSETAMNMYKVGIQIDTICQCTGFSREQVFALIREKEPEYKV